MIAPTSFFLDYGCHVRILEEIRVLQSMGHTITLITYAQGRNIPDLEIIRTRPTPWHADYEVGSSQHKIAFDLLLAWTGLKTILRRRFDVVHGHLHEGGLIGYFLSRLMGVPLILDMQGSMTSEMTDHGFLKAGGFWYHWLWLLERRICHMADLIVTSTQRTAYLAEHTFGCCRQRIYPLPDCVNLDFFHPDVLSIQQIAKRREALGIPPGRLVVAYLGLLAEYQGTSLLVQAAQITRSRGLDLHFLIMGFPSVSYYQQMARELGVSDRVTFTGKVPYEEAPAHLALSDIAVAPKLSATEGAGKILNYMAMGLPVVAFDTPINREYMGPLGAYAGPDGDPVNLADAITELANRPERREELGAALRVRAAQHFSWERSGHELIRAYRQALDPATRRLSRSCSSQ